MSNRFSECRTLLQIAALSMEPPAQLKTVAFVLAKIEKHPDLNSRPTRRQMNKILQSIKKIEEFKDEANELSVRLNVLYATPRKRLSKVPPPVEVVPVPPPPSRENDELDRKCARCQKETFCKFRDGEWICRSCNPEFTPQPAAPDPLPPPTVTPVFTPVLYEPPSHKPPTEQEWVHATEISGRIPWTCVKCHRQSLVDRDGHCRACGDPPPIPRLAYHTSPPPRMAFQGPVRR